MRKPMPNTAKELWQNVEIFRIWDSDLTLYERSDWEQIQALGAFVL